MIAGACELAYHQAVLDSVLKNKSQFSVPKLGPADRDAADAKLAKIELPDKKD